MRSEIRPSKDRTIMYCSRSHWGSQRPCRRFQLTFRLHKEWRMPSTTWAYLWPIRPDKTSCCKLCAGSATLRLRLTSSSIFRPTKCYSLTLTHFSSWSPSSSPRSVSKLFLTRIRESTKLISSAKRSGSSIICQQKISTKLRTACSITTTFIRSSKHIFWRISLRISLRQRILASLSSLKNYICSRRFCGWWAIFRAMSHSLTASLMIACLNNCTSSRRNTMQISPLIYGGYSFGTLEWWLSLSVYSNRLKSI